jgi:apyrase
MIVDVKVLSRQWKLYTHSYLGWGLEQAQEKHQHTEAVVDAVDLAGNPCYPPGYHHSSVGHFGNCYRWLESVVPYRENVTCPYDSCGINQIYQPQIQDEPFWAIENFYYTSKYFGVHESLDFMEALKVAGEQYCSRKWADIIAENDKRDEEKRDQLSDLVKYCFSAAYSTRVLEVGFGLKNGMTSVSVMREPVKGRPIDWALGSVLDTLIGPVMPRSTKLDDDRLSNVVNNQLHSGSGTNATSHSTTLIWLSIMAVPTVAVWVIIKQCFRKWSSTSR